MQTSTIYKSNNYQKKHVLNRSNQNFPTNSPQRPLGESRLLNFPFSSTSLAAPLTCVCGGGDTSITVASGFRLLYVCSHRAKNDSDFSSITASSQCLFSTVRNKTSKIRNNYRIVVLYSMYCKKDFSLGSGQATINPVV